MDVKIISLIIIVIVAVLGIYFAVFQTEKKPTISELKIEKPNFEEEPALDFGPLLEEGEQEEKLPVQKPSLKKSDLMIEAPSFEEAAAFDVGSLF